MATLDLVALENKGFYGAGVELLHSVRKQLGMCCSDQIPPITSEGLYRLRAHLKLRRKVGSYRVADLLSSHRQTERILKGKENTMLPCEGASVHTGSALRGIRREREESSSSLGSTVTSFWEHLLGSVKWWLHFSQHNFRLSTVSPNRTAHIIRHT